MKTPAPASPPPPSETPPETAAVPSTHSGGLDLGRSTASSTPAGGLDLGRSGASSTAAPGAPAATGGAVPRPVARAALLFDAPGIADVTELGAKTPVLRLSALQSAVGTLLVTGTSTIVWESTERVTGALTVDGHESGSPVQTSGHRPLLDYDESDACVALRHVRELRRALFIARGPAPIGVRIFDGATVTVSPGDDTHLNVLHLLRIDNVVELRAESIDKETPDESIWQQFGFVMTHRVAAQRTRSH